MSKFTWSVEYYDWSGRPQVYEVEASTVQEVVSLTALEQDVLAVTGITLFKDDMDDIDMEEFKHQNVKT